MARPGLAPGPYKFFVGGLCACQAPDCNGKDKEGGDVRGIGGIGCGVITATSYELAYCTR